MVKILFRYLKYFQNYDDFCESTVKKRKQIKLRLKIYKNNAQTP